MFKNILSVISFFIPDKIDSKQIKKDLEARGCTHVCDVKNIQKMKVEEEHIEIKGKEMYFVEVKKDEEIN